MIGFKMTEVMQGFYEAHPDWDPVDQDCHFMEFVIDWGPSNILDWLNPFGSNFMTQPLSGYITLDGICTVPCTGTLTLAYHKGEIQYDIYFTLNDWKFHYIGKKTNIRPWNLLISHTTCRGEITREGPLFSPIHKRRKEVVYTSTVYFNFATMPDFIRSFRITNK